MIGIAKTLFKGNVKVVGGVPTDADAQAFIDAAGITDTTQKSAVNQLVLDLKGYSIWTKMKAIYPIIGGSASTHKWNLKDPRDLDAAFRLLFNGGITHSSSGILFNNTNGWADTFINMSLQFVSQYDVHLSANIYNDATGTFPQGHIGANSGSTSVNRLGATLNTNQTSYLGNSSGTTIAITVTSTTHKGFWCGSRTSNVLHNFIQPNSTITSNTGTSTSTLPNLTIGLGCRRGTINDYYSGFGYSFFSVGTGLSTTEMSNFKTAVNNFNTTLGRI